MATNNVINSPLPTSVTNGGTGLATLTAHGIMLGEGTSTPSFLVLTAGQVAIGTTASDPVGATLTPGTNIGITSATGSITINATGAASFAWNNVASSTQSLAVNQGYMTNNGASLVTYTLPVTAAIGTIISVAGYSSGGWTIAQNSSQEIFFGNVHTTIGTGGSLSSSNQYDQVTLLCTVANTDWVVTNSIGNLTYV